MRLVILDPNLVDTHGHHALYDRLIAGEARRRDREAVILANRAFGSGTLDGIPVHPVLETTCYRRFSEDPLFGAFDDVEQGNRAVLREMAALPADFFRRSDLVVVHTVSQITLPGLVTWIASLAPSGSPRFAIFLMLPSGIGFGPDGTPEMDDPAAAVAYREAFRIARESGAEITFFASGHQHARQFSALSGSDIPSHALLTVFDEMPVQAAVRDDRILLYAGDAKMNKGLGLLPELVERLCPRFPTHEFVIHANPAPAWGEALEVVETLRGLAPRHDNLDLRLAPLPAREYADLLSGAAIVLLPYDPDEYRRKSSGVVWESIASESRLVVPRDTWLEAECRHWEAAFESYAPGEAEAALSRAIGNLGEGREQARRAARRFGAANGIKALFDQLAEVWVGRAAVGRAPEPGQGITVPAADFGTDGWHEPEHVGGRPVRWSTGAAALDLTLPGLGEWTIAFRGPVCFGADQLEGARILIDGAECPVRHSLAEDGSWELSCTFRETRPDMPARRLSLHPGWARPGDDGDPRELGLLTECLTLTEGGWEAPAAGTALRPAAGAPETGPDGWSAPFLHAGWICDMGMPQDCVAGFSVEGRLAPEEIARMRILVNDQPVRPRLQRDGDWHVQLQLPAALTRGRFELDVILPAPARVRMAEHVRLLAAPAGAGEGGPVR